MSYRLVCMGLIGWVLLAETGDLPLSAAGKEPEVGVNPRTGLPIAMPESPQRPVLPVTGFNPYYISDAHRQQAAGRLQKLSENNAAGLEGQMAKLGKETAPSEVLLGETALLGRSGTVSPERYAECICKGLDLLLAADKADSKGYHALYNLMLKYGKPSPDAVKKHGQAIKAWMFPDGKLDITRCSVQLCDMIWDSGVLTKSEKECLEAYHLASAGAGVNWGCNNGRWGWICHYNTALTFTNPDLMQMAVEDLQHWLGHDIYPDGANHDNPSYGYCHSSRGDLFQIVAAGLRGFDPETFAAPSMPNPLSTNRDGFEDTSLRDLRSATGVAWRSIGTWKRWAQDRSAPDGTIYARGDTNPDGVARPGNAAAQRYESDVPLLSTNSTSIQILRGGGPAEDYEQKLRDAPKGKEEREPMIYACLDGAATDPCHNHMNMLQLLIWGKGAWLADDNGCRVNWLSGTYDREVGTYNYKTYAHNTVTVDQLPQYIANSTPLFFGSQPGFRIAAMDAGHVYDGVYHQRTVAMTDQYIVDMNLLPPRRDAPAGTTHTFDYLFQGTGRFDLAAMKFSTPYANDWQHQGADGRGLDEYLRWPNLTFIYPFINWSTPGKTSGHWDLTWGLPDGPSLRVVVLNDKPINVAYGMAQLGIRGPSTFDALVLGVPKILARQTGPEARFLTLLEPFRGQSQIATYARLDDQAARVELGDGTKDFILLQRQMPSHVFLRVRDGRLAAARFFAGSNLTVGGKALLQTTAPVHAAGVLFRDGKAYVSASTDKACLLSVACEGEVSPGPSVTKDAAGFRIALQPGDARFAVSGTNLAGPTLADSALATLATENPPRPPAEVGGDYALDRAKRLWQEPYIHPQVYHDGAYKGLKGADSHWSVDVTDDGKVVTGTHFGTVECFDAAGHKLWAYVADGRCAWNIGWNAWYHHRPLHISSDGARVIAGSEFGTVHFLDGEGRYLWKKNLGSRITDICPDSSWTRFAIATEKGIAVLDRDGNTSVELQTGGMVYGIRMADDGSFAARLTRKVDASPAAAAVIAGTTSRETVVIASFDPSGRERWFVNSPPTLRTGRSLEAQAIASSPLNGHRFAAFDMTPDGQRIAAASSNTRLYAFDGRSGKMLWETGLHDTSAAGLRISADARTVYAYGIGGVVLACTGDGKMLWRYRTTFGGYSLDATPDGGRVCVPNATGDVTILARDKKVITRSPVHTVEPMGVAISPNGRYFAVGGVGYDLLLFENRE